MATFEGYPWRSPNVRRFNSSTLNPVFSTTAADSNSTLMRPVCGSYSDTHRRLVNRAVQQPSPQMNTRRSLVIAAIVSTLAKRTSVCAPAPAQATEASLREAMRRRPDDVVVAHRPPDATCLGVRTVVRECAERTLSFRLWSRSSPSERRAITLFRGEGG